MNSKNNNLVVIERAIKPGRWYMRYRNGVDWSFVTSVTMVVVAVVSSAVPSRARWVNNVPLSGCVSRACG